MSLKHFISYKAPIAQELPSKFTFPFNYTPNPLVLQAAAELQEYLSQYNEDDYDFRLETLGDRGKMFGVLVVQTAQQEVGYLTAYSGTLNGKSETTRFVPPVHNVPVVDGVYDFGMFELTEISQQVKLLEERPEYLALLEQWNASKREADRAIATKQEENRKAKALRKAKREEAQTLAPEVLEQLKAELGAESVRKKNEFKALKVHWEKRLNALQQQLEVYEQEIKALKTRRGKRSGEIQQELFGQYHFLNINGEERSLLDIFKQTPQGVPPAAAGDCAAPKLLQYAFENQLRPIAMGEFWWGAPPKSELRKHGSFYPACRGKCEPILGHMLAGMELEEDPLLSSFTEEEGLNIIFEDEHILVANKPHGLLSVPGKEIKDSMLTRVKQHCPEATGSIVVHRLDMATSGVMVFAKSPRAHKYLHKQFEKRTIQKRYVALLDGMVEGDEGIIDLPLRVDVNDRPRQLVCEEHGKPSQTKWKVIERVGNRTKVHFFPITGRSHQLRVHSAHQRGLNIPIVGDGLYGMKSNRLHLHAEVLEFMHPIDKSEQHFKAEVSF